MSPIVPHSLWKELRSIVLELEPEIRAIRQHFHQYPEPSNEEFQTTAKIAEILGKAGIETQTAPTGRGLVADSKYQDAPRRVALRADMDAKFRMKRLSNTVLQSQTSCMHAATMHTLRC